MNFAFLFGPGARDSSPSLAPHEGPAREPRHDRHGVVRGAEFQVCLVRETLETLRRAVVAQRPRGAPEVTLDDGAGPTRPARHPAPPHGAEWPRPRPRFPNCLNDPGAVRRREGNPGARGQVRKFDARISVGGLPKSKPATFALPRSPMRRSAGSDAASSMEATGTTRAPRDKDRDRGARPERVHHDHHRPGPAAARLSPCPRSA
jgi:hypothetical protein